MTCQEAEKYRLAIVEADTIDATVERGYYLVKESVKYSVDALELAAVEIGKSDRSWEITDLPFTWEDFLIADNPEILSKHGIEKVTPFRNTGREITIVGIEQIGVCGGEVLVENSRWLERQKFKFEPYMSCGLAAVSLLSDGEKACSKSYCLLDSENPCLKTYFFLVDPKLKGRIEDNLKAVALEYVRKEEKARFNNGLTWCDLFCSVPEVRFEKHGLMHVTNDSFTLINPHIVWIEDVTLDNRSNAVTAAEVAQIE